MSDVATLGPGIHQNVPMEDYLALPFMSASRLERFRRSPMQYRHSLTAPAEVTPALERGTALHLAILEPALFEGRYVVLGICEGRKKDGAPCSYQGSVYRDGQSFCKTHDPAKGEAPDPRVEIMQETEYAKVLGMAAAIRGNPRAWSCFEGRGDFEATIIFEDPETGVVCRIRPDRLVERAGMHVALKSTRDASEHAFRNDAERRGYFRSFALYRRGLRAVEWPYQATAVVAPEPEAPHDLDCFLVDEGRFEAALETADVEVSALLRQYAECEKDNHWPGYCRGEFRLLTRPSWATKSEEAA